MLLPATPHYKACFLCVDVSVGLVFADDWLDFADMMPLLDNRPVLNAPMNEDLLSTLSKRDPTNLEVILQTNPGECPTRDLVHQSRKRLVPHSYLHSETCRFLRPSAY